MKQLKLTRFLVCGFLVIMAVGCKKEEATNKIYPCNEPYEIVELLSDAEGIIGYDINNKQYTINVYLSGTIDEITTAYPCELSEEFKKVNLNVKIKGELFTSNNLPKPTIGGQQTFYIDMTDISIINK